MTTGAVPSVEPAERPARDVLSGPVTRQDRPTKPGRSVLETRSGDRAIARALGEQAASLTVPRTMPPPNAIGQPRASLRALFELAKDARVVGLGEAGHGLEAYGRLRNQLFAELVRHAGFTAITLESGIVEAAHVDRYVTHFDDDGPTIEAVLERGFTHGMGPYEETRELVEWVRAYNADAAERGRPLVRFFGKDLPREGDTLTTPLAEVRAYLESIGASEIIEPAWTLASRASAVTNEVLDAIEAAGHPRVIDPDLLDFITSVSHDQLDDAERAALAAHVHALGDALDARAAAADAPDRHAWARSMVRVAEQLLADLESRRAHPRDPMAPRAIALLEEIYAGRTPPRIDPNRVGDVTNPDHVADYFAGRRSRERHLSENVLAIAEHHKTLSFSHNSHLARGETSAVIGGRRVADHSEGHFVADVLGDAYRVIACTHGAGEDGVAAPAGTLEATLAAAGEGRPVVVDLTREAPASVAAWRVSDVPARHANEFVSVPPAKAYDAIVYLPRTGAAKPLAPREDPAKALRQAIGRGEVDVASVAEAARIVERAGHSLEALTAFTRVLLPAYERGRMPADARRAFREAVHRLHREAYALAMTPGPTTRSSRQTARAAKGATRLSRRHRRDIAKLEGELEATVARSAKQQQAATRLLSSKRTLLSRTEEAKGRSQTASVAKGLLGFVPGVKLATVAALVPGLGPLALLAFGYGGYQAVKGFNRAEALSEEIEGLTKKIDAAGVQLADLARSKGRFDDNVAVLADVLATLREVETEYRALSDAHERKPELLAYNLGQQAGVLAAMVEQASEIEAHLGRLVAALDSEVALVERTSKASEADFITAVLTTLLPAAGVKGLGAEVIREAVLWASVGKEVTTIEKVRRALEKLGVDEAERPAIVADAAQLIEGVERIVRHRADVLAPAFDDALEALTEPQRFLVDVALSKGNTTVDPATLIALARQTDVDDATARRVARLVARGAPSDEALAPLRA